MDDAIVWAWTEIGIELLVCDGVAIWTWGEASWIAEVGEARSDAVRQGNRKPYKAQW